MPFKREKPLPSAETPAEPERTPEYSRETLNMIESLDNGLADSENLLSGLGRLAREQIITDPKELEEIYAPKQIGKLGLEKYDASIFEAAGRGLRIRNAINLGQYKYALRGEEGMVVDTRKLKEEAEGEKFELNADELKKIKKRAEKFGLNPEEINPQNLKTTFIEGEKGAEKIILRKKTEQEADQTAGNILERRLKELETKPGQDLIKQKENLEEFIKEKKQHASILDEASLAKVENEEIARQELIKQNQETLNSDLEIFGQPLWEHRQELASALSDFSFLLEEVTGQEKIYEHEINGLQTKISKIKGSKQIREILGDNIKEWEEQKAQAEVNLKDFKEKKEALNKRISKFKTSQAEVDAALDRINNIGKTKQELKAEKAAKQLEKLEQQKKNRAHRAPDPTPDFALASTEAEEDNGAEAARVAGAAAGASPANKYSLSEEEARRWQNVYKELEEGGGASPVVLAPESKKPEAKAYATLEQPREMEPTEEEINNKVQVEDWLILLGLINAVGPAKTAVENNFKVGEKKFDLTASLTLEQAKQAYIKFIIDFRYNGRKIYLMEAEREADAKFKEIIESLE